MVTEFQKALFRRNPLALSAVPWVLLLSVSMIGACSRRPVAPVDVPSTPLSIEETARVVELLERQSQSVQRYQAVIRVRGKGPEGKFRATELMIFERPDRIRVELLATFGASRWIAVASAGEITVLFPRSSEYLEDSAVEDVVGALLGIRLSPGEVMAILAGTGLPITAEKLVRAERRGDRVRLVLEQGRADLANDQVLEAEHRGYRVQYPTEWKQAGKPAPDRIEIVTDNIQASLAVFDLDINVRLDPEAFVIVLPEGATRLGLAQIGGEAVFVKPSQ